MNNKIVKKGKVYIAGAGCGDEKLITVKLKEVIEEAECIVYDRLVNENILNFAKKNVELIYMGKENTEGGELQEKINKTIVEKGLEGKKVLRLKGGDPFVFGRGGEEIESLVENGIEFEVIPGITSAIAVPAYAGIPVTHRGINTSFHIFTGHTKIDGKDLDFKTIAKLQGTLIFLMGLSNLEKILENLIKFGKSKETPVAIIKNGTTTRQQVFTGTMENIAEIIRKNNVKSPVIILIGEVVNLRETMKWFEEKELFGKNILVTRNKEKQEKIIDKINRAGGQGINAPFIDIEYIDFEMPDLSQYSALLFNSVNSVIGFMKKVKDIRVLGDIKIGVVGEKTAEEIEKYKIIPDFYPKEYTVERLASESVNYIGENEKALFIVSDISPVKEKKYSELYNRNYEKLVVYKTKKVNYSFEKMLDYLDRSDILMFLSSSTFESFMENLGVKKGQKIEEVLDEKIVQKLKNKTITSIGPVTTKTIKSYGLEVEIEAEKYTEEGLFEAIKEKL